MSHIKALLDSLFDDANETTINQIHDFINNGERINEKLRAELATAKEHIAELEGRTCDRCGKYYECEQQRLINTVRRDYHTDYYLSAISGCSAFEPKKED